jgi:4-phosphopantoate--beta-alanine ligase
LTEIPRSHPRYASLAARERIAEGVKMGITSTQGLIAQGRGECFDYLLGEKTTNTGEEATRAAAAMLLLAQSPALSVNGNVAALAAAEMVELAEALAAPLEVNLFHRTEERVGKIAELLRRHGAGLVYGESPDAQIPGLDHARAMATRKGIWGADVVLVPLEDGDRCEALAAMGKKVIAIDLNPLSRTSRKAAITIVDNLQRAVPSLTARVRELSDCTQEDLRKILADYDNRKILHQAVEEMREHLKSFAEVPDKDD